MPRDLIRRVLMKIDKNYLPYENFVTFKFFKEVEVFDGVVIQRLPSKQGLYFNTHLRKGVKITEHYHNSKEYFFIKKGKILVNGEKELKEGDEIEFKPYELHKIKVLEECEMFVQLIKETITTSSKY